MTFVLYDVIAIVYFVTPTCAQADNAKYLIQN